ncbi:MAG: D-alanyl-D-alanine carboxypeptidase [Bacilli bacterium]|nr:D-alanyl-D-alanine carboxypeptidase [Bacilli bacterium]
MKNILKIITIFLLFFTLNVKALEFDITSKNAILYNLDSNEVLYEKLSDEKVQIASLTKLMTALITVENVDDINRQIIITSEDLRGLTENNLVTAGFTLGQSVTYKDLLYGLLLPSGADAATALSRNVSDTFIDLMNEKAVKLKMNSTHFSNVIGLDDENNYSTAKDLSILYKEVLKSDILKEIITSKEYTTSDGSLTFKSTISRNANKYGIDVHYILGGKTGTTDGAGLCLASIASENEVNYMLITLGAIYDKKAPHHIEDAKVIYDYFIQNYSNQKIVDKTVSYKTLKTKYLKEDKIKLYPKEDIVKYLPNNYDKNDVKYKYDGVEEVDIFTNKKLGELKIYYKDELINTQKVKLNTKIHFDLFKFLKGNIIYILAIITILFIIIKILLRKKSIKK